MRALRLYQAGVVCVPLLEPLHGFIDLAPIGPTDAHRRICYLGLRSASGNQHDNEEEREFHFPDERTVVARGMIRPRRGRMNRRRKFLLGQLRKT